MMSKRILAIFIVVLVCFSIVQPVFALSDMQGFGNLTITEDHGSITVTVKTEDETPITDRTSMKKSFDSIFGKYGKTLAWFTGISTITLVIIWVVTCVRLAFMAGEHWMLRRQLTFSLLWIGIAAALMGSATLILTIFQYVLI